MNGRAHWIPIATLVVAGLTLAVAIAIVLRPGPSAAPAVATDLAGSPG